jgi:hypothetical protein
MKKGSDVLATTSARWMLDEPLAGALEPAAPAEVGDDEVLAEPHAASVAVMATAAISGMKGLR